MTCRNIPAAGYPPPVILTLLIMLASCSYVSAMSSADYDLDWSTIDGGGGRVSAGQYTLIGTIGQFDAAYSAGSSYEMLGGFWTGGPVCVVDFKDFARFAQFWLQTGPDLPADLYKDDTIDEKDLHRFVTEWLYECPYDWTLR